MSARPRNDCLARIEWLEVLSKSKKAPEILALSTRGTIALDVSIAARNQSYRHERRPKIAPIIPIRLKELPADHLVFAAELKLDGFSGLADTREDRGKMLSKNLNNLKRFDHLLATLPDGCVFDGELCVLDQDGKPDFNSLLFGRGQPVYVTFDLLFYEREDIRSLPLKERRAILDKIVTRYGLAEVGLVHRLRQEAPGNHLRTGFGWSGLQTAPGSLQTGCAMVEGAE